MKKVLVITYYWPPSGGAGVQRWLKFVKYLRNYGWEPIIYTPENPEAPAVDYSLEKDIPENLTVIKTKIWEPYSVYKKFIGQKQDEKVKAGFLTEKRKPSLAENFSIWIRGNFFIPDARKFWIKPSVKFLTNYLRENPVDAMATTGPPHSMHMIGLGVKKNLGIPWLADFRDPWTNIDFYDQLKLSKMANNKHHKLERFVLQNADSITVISNRMAKNFERIIKRHYEVITNGFDEDDALLQANMEKDRKFSIVYIGSINNARNPIPLWKTLKSIIKENSEFEKNLEIKLVGPVDFSVKEDIKTFGLDKFITYINYIPHNKIATLQKRSQILLLLINNTPNAKMVVTGKLFEYIASGTPILCIGPEDGDAADIINETKSGIVIEFDDIEKLKKSIIILYKKFKQNELNIDNGNISKYSRKNLTKELSKILNDITP
ncbi:MAG: glycosyl transferase family 1 [Bacteroidetes bacterium 4484_276]|nr:MAG: glycosyl transferase family 1 [Bacteroidetes bacterium 4484_276]